MKQALKLIISLINNLILIAIAIIVFTTLSIIGIIWSFVSLFKGRKIGVALMGVSHYFKSIALSIDQLGNVAFAGLLNYALINQDLIKQAHQFGDPDETISEVLGWNEHLNTLSVTGKRLVTVLNWLDENHCEKSSKSAYEKALVKLNRYTTLTEIKA